MASEHYRPGEGWVHLGGAVYEHTTGVRVHVGGLMRTPTGDTVVGTLWPESRRMDRCIRMNGGNRRRGVMAWGLNKAMGGDDV